MKNKLYKDTFSKVTSSCENKMEVILNYKTKSVKHRVNKRLIIIAAVTAITIMLSFSVYALVKLLTPSEIARELEKENLAAAFENENGILIEESITSNGYIFIMHGFTIGIDLLEWNPTEIDKEQSYFVFSVQNRAGMPMDLDDYLGRFSSVVLFNGYKPWLMNSNKLGSGGMVFEKDGVVYVIWECDENIEIFADREVYFAIWERIGVPFAPTESLFTTHADGSITFVEGISSGHAMFILPIDPNKANPDLVNKKFEELGIVKEDAEIN